jgi:predicted dehydrogenase
MADETIGIIINGATSRIASTQHLENALLPIRAEGGLEIAGRRVVPRLLLVGRDAAKLEALAHRSAIERWTTSLDEALADPDYPVLFDAAVTHLRTATLARAIEAGKHIYTQKPVAPSSADGLGLMRAAEAQGLKHGAVEDKHYLPGIRKLKSLVDEGFFGRVRHFKLEFGWWVFDGREIACQRPSWNYRHATGGGLIFDMHPHWRYVIETILGPIARVVADGWTATGERIDEAGAPYEVDVEDSTTTLIELADGARGTLFASWATRVRRDEILIFQVDGTHGSAIAGLHRCYTQPIARTPLLGWSPNADPGVDYRAQWDEVPDLAPVRNSYRIGWEGFLAHVVAGAPFEATLAAGIRDVRLAEACQQSIRERRWVDMDAFPAT